MRRSEIGEPPLQRTTDDYLMLRQADAPAGQELLRCINLRLPLATGMSKDAVLDVARPT